MGRHSGISFIPDKNGHFTTYQGKRHRLTTCREDDKPDGPNYLAAMSEFAKLMAQGTLESRDGDTLRGLIAGWEEHLLATGPKSTWITARSLMKPIKGAIGHVPTNRLSAWMIEDAIRSHTAWNGNSKHQAFVRLKTCLAWNRERSRITSNPMERAKCPAGWKKGFRGAEYVLHPDLVALMLARASGSFRDLCFVLSRTGARPGELVNAVRKNYRPTERMIFHSGFETVLYKHKNAGRKKSGDPHRRIYLDPESDAIVAKAAAKGDRLFPAPQGGHFYGPSLQRMWQALLSSHDIASWLASNAVDRKHVIPYGFRHTWITNAITRGVPIKTVADLCGTSVLKIEEHYCHASANTGAMYEAYLSALK